MKIIGIDPGLTTGFAMYDTSTGLFEAKEYERAVLYRRLDRLVWLGSHNESSRPTIVIESFTINAKTAKKSQQPDALRVIGAVDYLRQTGGILIQFSPTTRKAFATDAKLKKLGWFSGGRGHADDAARHVLAYLATRPEGAALLGRLAA